MNKIILILIAALALSGALTLPLNDTQVQQHSVEPNVTPAPTPLVTCAPGPTPEVHISDEQFPREYVLLAEVPVIGPFDRAQIFQTQWDYSQSDYPFLYEGINFKSCLGMYIPAKTIENEWAQDQITYYLGSQYSEMCFSLFADTSRTMGGYEDFGTYRVRIYADDVLIYDSDLMYYDSVVYDKVIILPELTKMLKIQIVQKRGMMGTLDFVFGDFCLYLCED